MIDRVPLQYPLYGAGFGEAVSRFRRKLWVFQGRASRSEFWWAFLFMYIVSFALSLVIVLVWMVVFFVAIMPTIVATSSSSSSSGPDAVVMQTPMIISIIVLYALAFLVGLALFAAQLGVTVRRLHDGGFSGLWALLYLVPIGGYAVLIMCILDSKPSGMRFDPPAPGSLPPATGWSTPTA